MYRHLFLGFVSALCFLGVIFAATAIYIRHTDTPPVSSQSPSRSVSPSTEQNHTITNADNHSTIDISVGDTVTFSGLASSTQSVSLTAYNHSLFSAVSPLVLKAIATGQDTVEAQIRPICQPDKACPQNILLFTLTIKVKAG